MFDLIEDIAIGMKHLESQSDMSKLHLIGKLSMHMAARGGGAGSGQNIKDLSA